MTPAALARSCHDVYGIQMEAVVVGTLGDVLGVGDKGEVGSRLGSHIVGKTDRANLV